MPSHKLTTNGRVSWAPDEHGESVTVVRADLPDIADARHFQCQLTETDLVSMLAEIRVRQISPLPDLVERSRQLGLDADRTGGL